MEIRKIEGIEFVEYKKYKQQRRRMIIQIFFILAIIYSSYTMIKTVGVLLDNKKIIQEDPLRYGMDVHKFVSCTCYDSKGKDWRSNGTGFLHKEFRNENNYSLIRSINFSEFVVNENGTSRNN